MNLLKEKIQEALSSVLPISAIVLLLSVTLTPMPIGVLLMFLSGAVLLILGMGLFSLGADVAMMPMGNGIGTQLTKMKKTPLIILVCFLIGFFITISEPDLQVLARQAPAIPDLVIVLSVAVGVGAFFVVAMFRTIFKISLSHMLILCYLAVFVLSIFTPNEFLPIAFDSGGVTTGPMTVPFIMALGIGMAVMRSDKDARDDSFGLVALCSVGPIIAVMVLGILFRSTTGTYSPVEIPDVSTSQDVIKQFVIGLPHYIKEVSMALLPIALFFILFQLITKRFKKRQMIKMGIGVIYTFLGLALFLTGVNIGFMPAGNFIGKELASLPYPIVIIPVGMLVGYFIVSAEPAVHVLTEQVEEISSGAIGAKAMKYSLSIGVAVSVGLAMIRVLTGISIYWFLVPGYALAVGLTFITPKIFTAIAFDSGGVASGPMTATFLLPLAMGASEAVGGNILTDAFGCVAMVAMTPLITIQLLGVITKNKIDHAPHVEADDLDLLPEADDIIEYAEVNQDE